MDLPDIVALALKVAGLECLLLAFFARRRQWMCRQLFGVYLPSGEGQRGGFQRPADMSAFGVSNRALKFGSVTPDAIAAASWLDLWYNEAALKIPGPPQRPKCRAPSVARMGRGNGR